MSNIFSNLFFNLGTSARFFFSTGSNSVPINLTILFPGLVGWVVLHLLRFSVRPMALYSCSNSSSRPYGSMLSGISIAQSSRYCVKSYLSDSLATTSSMHKLNRSAESGSP